MKENKIAGATKVLLDIMYFVGMVVTLTLPVSFKWYGTVINPFFGEYYIWMVLIFMTAGVFAVLILRELRKMFRTVLADDCFVKENVKSLNRMGIYSFAIMADALQDSTLLHASCIYHCCSIFDRRSFLPRACHRV